MHRFYSLVMVVVLGILAHAVLLLAPSFLLKAVAVLVLTGLLPGALFVEVLVGRSKSPPDRWERILYTIACGYMLIVLVMLLLSYLPGGVAQWQTLVGFDVVLVILLGMVWRRKVISNQLSVISDQSALVTGHWSLITDYWPFIGLLIILLIGGFLRLSNLGYAEFQGDEARAALRAAAVIQGYENVLFLHRKGPLEILAPTTIYALTGRLTEASARLPFALAGLAGVLALFVLGWRMFGGVAGFVAALLVAVDGYFIGFARIVQYQSVVLLTTVVVVLILLRLPERSAAATRYLTLAACLLATGILAHYEAALALVPGIYLLWRWWRTEKPSAWVRPVLIAGAVGAVILSLFYAPYLLNPRFSATYAYLTDERIGGQAPYNNLADFFLRTTVYNTTYAVLLQIGLVTLALGNVYWRGLSPSWRCLACGGLAGWLALTLADPTWLALETIDLMFVFFLLALTGAWLLPGIPQTERMLWLWFGSLLVLALFFVAKPRTHVYVFLMPWMLLSGMTVNAGWDWVRDRLSLGVARAIATASAAVAILIFGSYAYWYFVYNQVEIFRTWNENRPAGFWTVYDQPDDRSLFGFPLRNGWKAIGVLYARGDLTGAYTTNGVDEWVSDWYTRGAERCLREHKFMFVADHLEAEHQLRRNELLAALPDSYVPSATVLVHDQPRLQVWEQTTSGAQRTTETLTIEPLAAEFDRVLSGADFPLTMPAVEPPIQHPLGLPLDERIVLEGYAFDPSVATPGETLTLTLYWRGVGPVEQSYRVVNQVRDATGTVIGQAEGKPGCDAQPTDDWPPGDLIVDRYHLPIAADARAGTYLLTTRLVDGETGASLPSDGSAVELGALQVLD